MTSPQPQVFQNAVLRSLPTDCIQRLRLKPVKLDPDRRIAGPADPVRWLLFVESGSVGLGVPLKDGSVIDTGIAGNKSLVCATALMGSREALHQATVRSPGHGFVCSIEHGLQEFSLGGQFHDQALACLYAQFMQASQIAACNRRHDVEQRLCRWMLHCESESGAQYIHATHESLADALGVRRTTVTVTMHLLRTQGLIGYSRGRISLIDRSALEARSCECFEALRRRSVTGEFSNRGLGNKLAPQVVPALNEGIHPSAPYERPRAAEYLPHYQMQ